MTILSPPRAASDAVVRRVTAPDPDAIARVQLVRKIVLLIAILGLVGLASVADTRSVAGVWSNVLSLISLAAMVVAIVGRAWCSLYIGGRKKAEIVDTGPYSLSRNPLYVFSFIGAFGIGAQSGSLILAALFLLIAIAVFSLTVRQEEAWLGRAFGDVYARYRARTPRFWPRFSNWRDTEQLEVRPAYFLRTLLDGSVLLLATPLFAGFSALQNADILPTLLSLR